MSLIDKKKMMVLGGQYVVVTVSWLSEENTYIERGKEKRRQGGMFIEREDEGGEYELGWKLKIKMSI